MRALVREAGLETEIAIDSAGTGGYHRGESPDARARAAGRRRGFEIAGAARQIEQEDFVRFDFLLAMDLTNLANLKAIAPNGATARLALLRAFDAEAPPDAAVPDPYYGGEHGFDEVLEQCERACRGLLAHIRREHRL